VGGTGLGLVTHRGPVPRRRGVGGGVGRAELLHAAQLLRAVRLRPARRRRLARLAAGGAPAAAGRRARNAQQRSFAPMQVMRGRLPLAGLRSQRAVAIITEPTLAQRTVGCRHCTAGARHSSEAGRALDAAAPRRAAQANAEPDLAQTGARLRPLVAGLVEGALALVADPLAARQARAARPRPCLSAYIGYLPELG